MNKHEVIDAVVKETGLSKSDVSAVIDATITVITKTLKTGNRVQLTGFGTFNPKFVKSRNAINPKTKAKIKTTPRTTVKFSVGKALANSVANVSKKKIEAAKAKAKSK